MPVRFVSVLGFLFAVYWAAAPQTDRCPDIVPADADRLARYVAREYQVGTQAGLALQRQEPVNEACYRKLVFRGEGALGPYLLTLFSSPDLRFLSSDLLDSSVDPEVERRLQTVKRIGQLPEGDYAAIGPTNSPVVLVVFSDFQCSYCRKMHEILSAQPLIQQSGKIRVIFRHLPGVRHDWAQKAAEAAACAQLQNADAFWGLHNALFNHQDEMTAANFSGKLAALAISIGALKISEFNDCMERQASLGIVLRDRKMAAALGVTGTPTIVISGEILTGLPHASDLHRRLEDALGEAVARRRDGK